MKSAGLARLYAKAGLVAIISAILHCLTGAVPLIACTGCTIV